MQSPFTCLDLKDKTNWGRMKDAHNVASAGATKGQLILKHNCRAINSPNKQTNTHSGFTARQFCFEIY